MIINKAIGAPEIVKNHLLGLSPSSFSNSHMKGFQTYIDAVFFHLEFSTHLNFIGEDFYEINLEKHLDNCYQDVEEDAQFISSEEQKAYWAGALMAEKVYRTFIRLAFQTQDSSTHPN